MTKILYVRAGGVAVPEADAAAAGRGAWVLARGNADVRDSAACTGSEDAAGGGAPGEMGDLRCERRSAGGAGVVVDGNAGIRDGAACTGSGDAAGGGMPGEKGDLRVRRFAGGAGGETSMACDGNGEA